MCGEGAGSGRSRGEEHGLMGLLIDLERREVGEVLALEVRTLAGSNNHGFGIESSNLTSVRS